MSTCSVQLDKEISTYFLDAPLFCVHGEIFDLSSWVNQNWDWEKMWFEKVGGKDL